jgi:hypothetical protein
LLSRHAPLRKQGEVQAKAQMPCHSSVQSHCLRTRYIPRRSKMKHRPSQLEGYRAGSKLHLKFFGL